MTTDQKTTLLSTRDVAARLGRSTRHVRRLIRDGRLRAKRDHVTETLYVPVQEVEAYEASLVDYDPTKPVRRLPPAAARAPAPAEAPAAPAPTRAPAAAAPQPNSRKPAWGTVLDD